MPAAVLGAEALVNAAPPDDAARAGYTVPPSGTGHGAAVSIRQHERHPPRNRTGAGTRHAGASRGIQRVAADSAPVVSVTRIVAAVAVVALLGAAFAFKMSARMPDFEVYWRAGDRAAAAEPLYRDEDGHYQLKYLPAFAMLAIPAALLPLTAAKAVWFTTSVVLIGVVLVLSLRLLPSYRKRPPLLVTLTLVVMAKFYGHELVVGQVNLLLAVLVLLAVHLADRGRTGGAGLVASLAIVIKPYAVIMLPWFAARGAARTVMAAGVGLALALALPALAYGPGDTVALHQAWWRTVTESTAPNLLNADNVSLAGMYAKWLGPGTIATALTMATALLLIGTALAIFAARQHVAAPAGLEAALLLTLIPLLSPQGWDYVFLLSTPAVMYLVNYERDLPQPLRFAAIAALAAIGLSLYDVMGREAYAQFMALSIITVCYLVVIAALVSLRLRRVA
jgi:hypothetical protein